VNTNIHFIAKPWHPRDELYREARKDGRLPSRRALLAATALTGAIALFTAWSPNRASAGDRWRSDGRIPSTGDTGTTGCANAVGSTTCTGTFNTSDQTSSIVSTNYLREQAHIVSGDSVVTAVVAPGANISGNGLAITNQLIGGDINFTNSGNITLSVLPSGADGGNAALNLNANGGNISYTGNGTVSDGGVGTSAIIISTLSYPSTVGILVTPTPQPVATGTGSQTMITGSGPGNIMVGSATAPVTPNWSGSGSLGPPNSSTLNLGVLETFAGTGTTGIYLSGGTITTGTNAAADGIIANAAGGNVTIVLTGNTSINNGSGAANDVLGISAATTTGTINITSNANIGATVPVAVGICLDAGSCTVNRFSGTTTGNINVELTGGTINYATGTITGMGIDAGTTGGNITVTLDRGSTLAGSGANSVGINALTTTGIINLTLNSGSAITTGGNGINATSNAGITVTNAGIITTGAGGTAISTSGSGGAAVTNTGTITGTLSLLGTGINTFNNNSNGTWNTSGTSSFAGTSVLNNNGGTINLSGSATLAGRGPFTINNNGAINVSGTATTQNLQSLTNSTNGSLTINGGGSFTTAAPVTNNGAITVGGATAGALLASAGITNNSGATITVNPNGTVTDTLTNSGTVTNSGAYNADVSNTGPGNIANNNIWNGNLLTNTGTVANSSTGTWVGNANNNGGTLNNSGVWNGSATNAGTFSNSLAGTVTGSLTNTAGTTNNAGTINGGATVTGGVLTTTGTISGGLTNSATVNASGTINGGISNNSGTFTVAGPLNANGAFTNASGASLLVGANAINSITTLTNLGTISLGSGSAGGTIGAGTVNNNGLISVSGNSVINGAVNNAGTISFTAPSQSLTTGNFASSPGSTIALLGSAGQGNLDRLIVNGTASGTVTLNLSGVSGICPSTPATVIQTGGGSLHVTSANGPAGCAAVPIAGGIGLVSTPSVVAAATVNRSTTQIEQTIAVGIEQHIQQIRDEIDYRRRLASTGSNPPLAYADDDSNNGLMSYASTQPRDAASGAPAMFTKGPPTASPPPSYGVWLQGFGDIDTRSIPGFEHTTYTAGVLGGVDKTWFSLLGADDALVLGLVSNYASANVNYSTSDLRVNINGPGIGGYGTYLKGAFSVDATAKVDIFDLSTISSASIPNSATLYNYSVAGNTQYKFDITKNIFFEPTVGFIYTYSQYADVAVPGVFNNGYDWRAQAGGRLGSWFDWNSIHFSSSLQALAYDDVKITGTTLQDVGLIAPSDEGKTRGQIDGVIDMDYGHGLSSFLRGEIRFGEDLFAYAFKGGMRYQW
jgi:hypothetical protein